MSYQSFRHITALLLLTGVFLLWRPPAIFAATGTFKQINFQGKVVTKTTGVNVADGSYTFVFTIYDAASGGTNLWSETKSVTVTNGIFQTLLGSSTALPGSIDFNTDNIYLGINFNSDGEMSPRVRFSAVPQAFNALKVAGLTVTDTTGTLTIPNGTTIAFSGANNVTFTTSGSTNITLPTTGTLATVAGAESLTNKTIGNTGLAFENSESISNGTDGTISFGRNDAGAVTLLAKDNDADADLSVLSGGTGALTVDSTSTGTVNLGTSNNAKTINVGTGTAGNTINVGTNNTTKDTITIGSALDDVAITGDQWSVTNAGVLTVVSCTGCGGGASTLQGAYDGTSGNTILTTSGRNIAFTLGEVVTPTSFTLENQDTAGTTAFDLTNSIASGTLTNGILITQSGAGTLTSALKITEAAGTITDGIVISGTLGNILNTDSIDITGAGAITGATGVSTSTLTASGAIAANGGITFDASTDTLGAFTLAGTVDANSNIITNIGATATDFTTSGSLAIGLDAADVNGALMVDNVAQANPIIVAKDNGTIVWSVGDGGLLTIDPATTGTIETIALATQWTTGTVINAAFGGATTQTAAINGIVFDFSTNLTVPNSASGNQTGLSLTMKDGGASATARGIFVDGTMDTGVTIGSGTSAITTGLSIASTGVTTDIRLQNGETISNATNDGTILLTMSGATVGFELSDTFQSFRITPSSGDSATFTNAASYNFKDSNSSAIYFYLSENATANATSTNQASLTFTTPVNTSGVNVNNGLSISTSIGNASSGTNTANILNLGAVSGDAQVTTNGINIGAMSGTSATETAIKIASGWDTDISGASWSITSAGALTVTSCSGCGGGGSTLKQAYDADADGSDAVVLMTSTDGSIILQDVAGTQFQVTMATSTAPTVDMASIVNTGASQATVTSGVDGLQVDFAIGATASVIDNAGLRVNVTSAAAGATSTLAGINIGNLSSANASVTETALIIGTGWDVDLAGASWSITSAGALTVTSCTGCGGGGGTLQQAYDADANGSDAIVLMTSTDGSIIFQTVAGTQFQIAATAAPTIDLQTITNSGFGTVTDAVDGLAINFTQGDDADATDTNMGVHITLTSSSGDADTLIGLDLSNVTGGAATEKAIRIGSGYDQDIEFVDTNASIRIPDAGAISFTEAGGGFEIAALKEYFSGANYGVFEANGFINIDGSFYNDNFSNGQVQATADAVGTGRYGDKFGWIFDEAGTYAVGVGSNAAASYGCAINQSRSALTTNSFGLLEIAPDLTTSTAGVRGAACRISMGNAVGAATAAVLNVANKWVMYWKVRPSANWTNAKTARAMYFGANNFSMAWNDTIPYGTSANPAQAGGGIHFYNGDPTNNNVGSNWKGMVLSGTLSNRTSVNCGVSVVTNAFALLRIEARATNDVGFYVDPDVSNGVPSFTSCGAATVNVPTVNLSPSANVGNSLATGQTIAAAWTVEIDLFAFVQDDPKGGTAPSTMSSPEMETAPATPRAPDPILGADLAENYYFDDNYEIGDIVVLGASPGQARVARFGYDRKILGVISDTPGLLIGEQAENAKPVALAGRVPTRVSNAGGDIRIGDPITSSEVPGVGMRATGPGKIVGTAMESLECSEDVACVRSILVHVNPGYYLGDEAGLRLLEQKKELAITRGASESAELERIASQSAQIGTDPDQTAGIIGRLFEFAQGVKVVGFFENAGTALFRGSSKFLSSVLFSDKVSFEQQVTFNSDSAGMAKIKKGQRFVDVIFEKEYDSTPVVNANLTIVKVTEANKSSFVVNDVCAIDDALDVCQDKVSNATLAVDVRFAVVSTSTQGFMILLSKDAPTDLSFNWSAIAVHGAKTSENNREIILRSSPPVLTPVLATPSPVISPLPLLSPLPTTLPLTESESVSTESAQSL